MDKYPFLFAKLENPEDAAMGANPKIVKWIVTIAKYHNLKLYDARWMNDPIIGTYVLVPDLDISESDHLFDEPLDALLFIKDWWTNCVLPPKK